MLPINNIPPRFNQSMISIYSVYPFCLIAPPIIYSLLNFTTATGRRAYLSFALNVNPLPT